MLKVTTWSPDTCKCVLEYSWDTDTPQDQRVHSPHTVALACSVHQGMDLNIHHSKVLLENQGKNVAILKVSKTDPSLEKIDADGNKSPDLSKIQYEFDANRKLKIILVGADAMKKSQAKKALDDHFGKDVVNLG